MSPSWTARGPISFVSGSGAHSECNLLDEKKDSFEAVVVPHPDPFSSHALVHPSAALTEGSAPAFYTLAEGSDCVVGVRAAKSEANVPPGSLALTAAQQINWHVKEGGTVSLTRFSLPPPDSPFSLVDVEIEVSSVGRKPDAPPLDLDAAALSKQFLRAYLGIVIAANQICVLPAPEGDEENQQAGDAMVVLRIMACNSLDEEARAEAIGFHCFRGIIAPDTVVYLTALEAGDAAAQSRAAVRLLSPLQRPPPGSSPHLIDVLTNDEECFPAHRKLLRPCIALTKSLRDESSCREVAVDVDTLTFDRVLIFLEAQATGRKPPSFALHLVPPLLEASQRLGLQSLQEWCQRRMGDNASRVRWYSFGEVQQRNAAGECILIIDGMVLDVTTWLSEHPGGSTIIPRQALNLDSSCFFELYHFSRESFLYLREFYAGEILLEDLPAVPRPEEEPSADFMMQLRQYTDEFRLKSEEKPKNFISF